MQKLRILMNEDKIMRENIYSLNEINRYIKKLIDKRNMFLDSTGWYTNGDFVKCGSLIATLREKEWFLDNVKEWFWYDDKLDSFEDLLEHYRQDKNIIYERTGKNVLCG